MHKSQRASTIAVLAFLFVWPPSAEAQSSQAPAGAEFVPPPAVAETPVPTFGGTAGRTAPVVLAPGDVLRITVWPNSQLSGEFAVEETGVVHLPFLGGVQAAGVSVDNLRRDLRDGYGELMKEPVVTVTPLFRVSVMGAVARPGIYMVTPTHDLLDVIGMAGGFVREADAERIRILRGDRVVALDAERALEGEAHLDELALRSGDRIVVPVQSGGISMRGVLDVLRTVSIGALLIERIVN